MGVPCRVRPGRRRPLRSCRLAGTSRHACWTAELGAHAFFCTTISVAGTWSRPLSNARSGQTETWTPRDYGVREGLSFRLGERRKTTRHARRKLVVFSRRRARAREGEKERRIRFGTRDRFSVQATRHGTYMVGLKGCSLGFFRFSGWAFQALCALLLQCAVPQ